MASRWYVLSSKQNKEEILLRQLQSQGYEVFYPRYFTANGKTGRLHIKSYFPNYLFIRLDFNLVSPSTFQWMPNAEGLVCFETRPAYVPDRLIEAIKKHVDKINVSRMRAFGADLESSQESRSHPEIGFNTVLDVGLTTGERVQGLLRMLQW